MSRKLIIPENNCERCDGLGVLMKIVDTLHGKDFDPVMCDCLLEKQYSEDRKVLIHDACEAAPELGHCSKGVRESPE